MRKDPSLSLANVPLASSVCGPTRTSRATAPQRLNVSLVSMNTICRPPSLFCRMFPPWRPSLHAHTVAGTKHPVIPLLYLASYPRRLARPICLYVVLPCSNLMPLFSSNGDCLSTFTMWSLSAIRRAYCAVAGCRVRCAPGCGGQTLPVKNALLMHYR